MAAETIRNIGVALAPRDPDADLLAIGERERAGPLLSFPAHLLTVPMHERPGRDASLAGRSHESRSVRKGLKRDRDDRLGNTTPTRHGHPWQAQRSDAATDRLLVHAASLRRLAITEPAPG